MACSLISCDKRPQDVLSPKQMTEIITDLQLNDAACQLKNINASYSPAAYAHYYNQIFEKYDIAPAAFDSSLKWYTMHDVVRLRKIYSDVEKNIKEMQNEFAETK